MVTLALFLIGILSLLFLDPNTTAFHGPLGWHSILQVFSHMVSHANWGHLLGNFIFGWGYMVYAEMRLKNWKKFLVLFFVCGLAGLAGQLLFDLMAYGFSLGMIGSSAAIFGCVAYALCIADEAWWIKWPAKALCAFFLVNQLLACWAILHGAFAFIGYAAHASGIICGISLAYLPVIRQRLPQLTSRLKQLLHCGQ